MDYSSQFGLSLTGGNETDEINDEITTIKLEINSLVLSLSDESETREIADNQLTQDLSAETSQRTTADTTLQTNINTETSQRTIADTTLQTNINTETSQRTIADETLQTNINTETSQRTTADETLQTNINTETSQRTTADATLQTNITTERGERILADLAIDFRLDNIELEIDAIDELITGGQHIIDINDDITELKANTSNAFLRYTEGDSNLLIGTIENGIETNAIRYNANVGAFNLLEPNGSIVLNDTTNTNSRWQITTTAGKTIFNYIASSGVVDTIFTINSNGNIEVDNVITNQGNLNNILANNSSTLNSLQTAVSNLQQLQADLQAELNSTTQDDDGNPILGIVGTVFGTINSLSIVAIATQVAFNTTAISALTTAVGVLQGSNLATTVSDLADTIGDIADTVEEIGDAVDETTSLIGRNDLSSTDLRLGQGTNTEASVPRFRTNSSLMQSINFSSAGRYFPLEMSGMRTMSSMSTMSVAEVETGGTIENLGEMLFFPNNSGNIQHLTSINSVLLLDASDNEIPQSLTIACETSFGNEIIYKTETLDTRFVNQTDYAGNNTAITNNSAQLADNITAIADNITTINTNNTATNALIDSNNTATNALIASNNTATNALIASNDTATNALIASNNTATTATIDALDIRVATNTTNLSNKADISYVNTAIASILDNSPEALDTLFELAEALGNNENFATDTLELIGTKASSTDLDDAILQIQANNNLRIDGDALKLDKSGGTMTGGLFINGGDSGLTIRSSSVNGATDTAFINLYESLYQGGGTWGHRLTNTSGDDTFRISKVENANVIERLRINANGTIVIANDLTGTTANFTTSVTTPVIQGVNVSNPHKIRLWNENNRYTIGMITDGGNKMGGLLYNATTFTMNDDNQSGWLFRDTGHTTIQGAMGLTTNGRMTLATSLRLGYGDSDVTTPTVSLDVGGSANISGDLFMRELPPTDRDSGSKTIFFDVVDDNGYANIPDGSSLGQIIFRINENSDYIPNNIPIFQDYSMIRGEVDSTNNISSLGGALQGGLSFWTRSDGQTGTTGLQKRMMIRHTGDVGIGTDNPQAKLDVNGDANISGLTTLLRNGSALELQGTDHVFSQWYVGGIRRAQIGFTQASSQVFNIINEYTESLINISAKDIVIQATNSFLFFLSGVSSGVSKLYIDATNISFDITNTFNLIPTGTILTTVAGLSAPSGYLSCNGQLYNNTQYPKLRAILGTAYGGNTTQFNVPNFRGAFLRGTGSQIRDGITYASANTGDLFQADQVLTPNTPTVTNRGYFNVPAGSTRSVISRSIISGLAADSNTGIAVNVSFPRQGFENRPMNYAVSYWIRF